MTSFFHGGATAGFGKTVIAAAFVVVLRIGTLFQFFDEALFEEAFDGAIQSAGAEANLSARSITDFLHDGIAVAVAIGERHENVESIPGKKKGSHGQTIAGFAIADKGVFVTRLWLGRQVIRRAAAISKYRQVPFMHRISFSVKRKRAAPSWDI